MEEYVVVTYQAQRRVYIDGKFAGSTGDTLMVETGNHFFHLGKPKNYLPHSVARLVENTTSITPLFIEDFHPKAEVI